jgi:hypothetical protein
MNKDSMQNMHLESDLSVNEKDSITLKGNISQQFNRVLKSDSEVTIIHFILTYEQKWNPRKPLVICIKKITKQMARKVRLVSKYVKIWIEENWPDFQRNLKKRKFANLFQELIYLISTTRKDLSDEIQKLIEIREQTPIPSIAPIKQVGTFPVKVFTEIWFKISDQELSKFLTCIESRYWKSIENVELLSGNWIKENRNVLAPHITEFTVFTNYMTGFIHTSILSLDLDGDRVYILKRWVTIAKIEFDSGNYSTATYIIFSLNSYLITRLTKIFDQFKLLHPTLSEVFYNLTNLFDPANIPTMYNKCLNTYPNCLASPCLMTKILATSHESIKDDIPNGIIDWANRERLGAVLYQIRQWQIPSFESNLLEDHDFMQNFYNLQVLTEDQRYHLSKQIQPPSPSASPPPSPLPSPLDPNSKTQKRLSHFLKEKLIRPPLLPINESLSVSHTTPPLSPLSNSNSENLPPEENRNNLKRVNTNAAAASPRVSFVDKINSLPSPPSSPRISKDSSLPSPHNHRIIAKSFTQKACKIESSHSEAPAAPLERLMTPRKGSNNTLG